MENKWKPIKTAPKDRRILLFYPRQIFIGIHIIVGKWESDSYIKHPKPYWEHDLYHLSGKIATRNNQPTHWMELIVPE